MQKKACDLHSRTQATTRYNACSQTTRELKRSKWIADELHYPPTKFMASLSCHPKFVMEKLNSPNSAAAQVLVKDGAEIFTFCPRYPAACEQYAQ